MPRFSIFISYRRSDTPDAAGVLYDALASRYGEANVFMDVELRPGTHYEEEIMQHVRECDVLIALIGPNWLTASDEDGRRLDDEDDILRREIAGALERGAVVIPVLAGNVEVPRASELPDDLKAIPAIQSFRLDLGREYRTERTRLIQHLEAIRNAEPRGVRRWLRTRTHSASATNPRSRRRLAAIAAVVGAAALAGGLALVLTEHSSGSKNTPTPQGAAFPDAIESELLLAHIPSALRSDCHRVPPVAPGVFLRSVTCAGLDGADVTYSRAHSGQALAAYFLQQVASVGSTFPTKGHRCADMPQAADAWVRAGIQTHDEDTRGVPEGRILCYRSSSDATIAWTDTPTKIYAFASAPTMHASALYRFWRTTAGPEKELVMHDKMSAMGAWPDAIEQELLLDHIPKQIRDTCQRSPDDYETQVFLRGVTCTQVPGHGNVEYLYAHSGTALGTYLTTRIGAIGLNGLGGSCARQQTAATAWSRVGAIEHRESGRAGAEGRVLCSVDGGRATIEWTDVPTGIYVTAARPAGQRRALYAWWQKAAGPGELEEMAGMSGGATGGTSTAGMTTEPMDTQTTMTGSMGQ